MRSADSKQEASMGIVRGSLVATALLAAATAMPGCITDPDCAICDPENLILETISASNYAGKQIFLLSPECKGEECPEALSEAKYYVNTIGPCEMSDDAVDSEKARRGAAEWCKISPLIVGTGINFVFNNLLDPQSIELVRKQPVNPQLFEVYDWRTRIVKIKGPNTRYNGDYLRGSSQNPDLVTRAVNLSCIENLADLSVPFDHTSIENNTCDGLYQADGGIWPLRTRLTQEVKAAGGKLDWRSTANSCDALTDGADTCCTSCDYELSVNISRYGAGHDASNALSCDPANDDKFIVCRDIASEVDRSAEDGNRYQFNWNGELVSSSIPFADRLRETHPADRPAGSEQKNAPCQTTTDCTTPTDLNLPGSECVGELADSGVACSQDAENEDCINRRCVAEWFISCETTQLGGRCVDKRFEEKGVAGCFTLNNDVVAYNDALEEGNVKNVSGGRRLAFTDLDENGLIEADEGCGQGVVCDPFDRSWSTPIAVYDRKKSLPEQARDCVCPTSESNYASRIDNDPECKDVIDRLCRDDGGKLIESKANQYAMRFVTKVGGVIYDPALKGLQFRAADRGTVGRARAEFCATGAKNIGGFNIKDGWRANDNGAESDENFDRAMCSSSEYEIVFAVPSDDGGQYLKDKVGNTLAGRRSYKFTTPDFHIVPGSGFPADNLRIGACDSFAIGFSNKYDMSPQNLRKLQIVELDELSNEVAVVAGGLNCTDDPDAVSASSPPCLTADVSSQNVGKVGVQANPKDFGQVLRTGRTYRLKVPGLSVINGVPINSYKDFQDFYSSDPAAAEEAYRSVFMDACGMPLIIGGASEPDHYFDFTVDPPKAKEDKDGVLGLSGLPGDDGLMCDRLGDGVQFSCDNAPDHYNPDQVDSDLDGFGDVYDLCPTIATAINTADSDKDGVGNECDTCVKQPTTYNKEAGMAGVPPNMMVFNTPYQSDADGDGIGDACDNCVQLSNCADFGNTAGLTPYVIGDVVPVNDTNICQTDIDGFKMIGDACVENGAPITFPGAAGPVGFGNDDDFDGDGIVNVEDYCPRLPVEGLSCTGDDECPDSKCTNNLCNHSDSDGDKVGDFCDTCPFDLNPSQIADGGIQDDDADGDFVGRDCETNAECYKRFDPRPYSFYDVQANGWCCTVALDELSKTRAPREPYEVVQAEDGSVTIVGGGRLLTVDCPDAEDPTCRKIPDEVLGKPGMVALPPGCEGALIDAGYDPANKVYATRLALADVDSEAALWDNRCTLPQLDQDFDGIGDICDLCPFAFDPDNEPYVNENGRLFAEAGKYCNGTYALDQIQAGIIAAQPMCYDEESEESTGGDTDGTGTGTGGSTGG